MSEIAKKTEFSSLFRLTELNKFINFFSEKKTEHRIIWEQGRLQGKVNHELRVTSSNPQVTSSNPRVTSSNPRVRVQIHELRVQIHELRVQTHEL